MLLANQNRGNISKNYNQYKETPFLRTIFNDCGFPWALNLVTMSLTDIFAEPMLDSDEYLEKYKQQLIERKKKKDSCQNLTKP